MKLKFNGNELSDRFYDPRRGDVGCQIERRQPFGTVGVLELRGKQGGQQISVPIRLAFKSYSELKDAINACYLAKGTNGDLELEYTKSTKKVNGADSYPGVTLDSVQELRSPSVMVYDSELKGPGWQAVLLLTFFSLGPPSGVKGGRSGFGK